MKKYFSSAIFTIILMSALIFGPGVVAKAQSNNIGSGGSTSIIGLPSGRAYFQDAASQAQNGTYNNPAGGSSLLQENKAALLIVDSPFTSALPVTEPEVSNTNIWWAVALSIVALIGLAGIAVVLVPQRVWQTEADEELPQQLAVAPPSTEEVPITPLPATIVEPIAQMPATTIKPIATEAPAPVITQAEPVQAAALAGEVLPPVAEADNNPNQVQVVDMGTEEAPEPPKPASKKHKHDGRPVKKHRK